MAMDLSSYLAAERGRAAALARDIGVAAAFLSQMASGVRRVSPALAVRIEKATAGVVSRRDLRPEDWQDLWPEISSTR